MVCFNKFAKYKVQIYNKKNWALCFCSEYVKKAG